MANDRGYLDASVDIRLSNFDSVYKKMRLGVQIANLTEKVIAKFGLDVAEKSEKRIWDHRHPSGLYRKAGKQYPLYRVVKQSPFYYRVYTPLHAWSVPASRTEMMKFSTDPRGNILIRELNKEYGDHSGRVMYHVFDELDPTYQRIFEQRVAEFEREINKTTE